MSSYVYKKLIECLRRLLIYLLHFWLLAQVYLPVEIRWDGEGVVTTCCKYEADWVTDIFSQVYEMIESNIKTNQILIKIIK
jgi:hypothetical protein